MIKKFFLTLLIILLGIGFIYSQTITVTSPHSGDTWVKGQRYTIRWTKSGRMNDFVKIRLYQGDTKILGIVDRTENDGSFDWTVPDTINPGTYKIRVKTIDNLVYDDSEDFTIENSQYAMITVTLPYSGDTWVKGQRYTIRWTKSGNMNDFVKIRLYQGNTKILGIVDRTENNGRFKWMVPINLSAGTYKIRVKTVDNQVYGDSAPFTIENPYIRIKSPRSNDVWYKGKTYRIKWKAAGIPAGTLMKINIYKDLIAPSNLKQQLTCTSKVSKNLFQMESWTIPTNFESGRYYIRIKTDNGSVYGDSAAFIISIPLVKNGNLITKKNKANSVSKIKFPDLVVLREDISKKVEGFYEKIRIHVVVKNMGLADAGSVPYLFKIIRTSKGVDSTVLAERGSFPPIQRGEVATFDEHYLISMSKFIGSEKYTFVFEVNPLDNGKRTIIETSYNNNKISKSISFYPKIK